MFQALEWGEPLNILYVCSDFGIRPQGVKGASIHLRSITRALSDLGHCVSLLSPHPAPDSGHPVIPLPIACDDVLVEAAGRLRHWLKGHHFSHSAGHELRDLSYNMWVVDRACALLDDQVPDAIVERLSLFGSVGMELAERWNCPHIVEVNALLSREAAQYRDLEMGSLACEIEQRVLNSSDAVTVVSRELSDELTGIGVDGGKIHVVPNGTDVDLFDPKDDGKSLRRQLGLGNAFVVGFAGSLKAWHGVDVLVTAFKEVLKDEPRSMLLIVGTGPMEDLLRTQAMGMGIGESVVFTGGVEHALIPTYLSAMDVAVAPFLDIDSFYFSPIKLFEYMAAGVCVIASELGQIADVIEDGHEGLLCPANDATALAMAMNRARQYPELRSRLGAAARSLVERKYTWRAAARKTSDIVEHAVQGRTSRARSSKACSIARGEGSVPK